MEGKKVGEVIMSETLLAKANELSWDTVHLIGMSC